MADTKPANKQVSKLLAKQAKRRVKTGLLPDPSLSIDIDAYTTFVTHLRSSKRICALLGAGLSAASGIPTFRGAGGYWRTYSAEDLATPEAFFRDPCLVWQFYNERRNAALAVSSNKAHFALAALAKKKKGFLAITQNIDGLSERAGHEDETLVRVHGRLDEIKCSKKECAYRKVLEPEEVISNGLPRSQPDQEGGGASDEIAEELKEADLPRCPLCDSLLRPAIVWFGEPLDMAVIDRIHGWFDAEPKVDLMLVVGTSAIVFPAAAYIHTARTQGARIAVFNVDEPTEEMMENPVTRLRDEDWYFQGSAADVLPEVLKEVTGVFRIRD